MTDFGRINRIANSLGHDDRELLYRIAGQLAKLEKLPGKWRDDELSAKGNETFGCFRDVDDCADEVQAIFAVVFEGGADLDHDNREALYEGLIPISDETIEEACKDS